MNPILARLKGRLTEQEFRSLSEIVEKSDQAGMKRLPGTFNIHISGKFDGRSIGREDDVKKHLETSIRLWLQKNAFCFHEASINCWDEGV